MHSLSFQNFQIISYSDQTTSVQGGYILNGGSVALEFKPKPKRYYRHGWQSWSLTTWQDANFHIPVQRPRILHPLQTDPLYVRHPAPNGSWVGAVEFENGQILLLGALGLDTHVGLHDQQLHGWCEVPRTGHEAELKNDWFVGYGDETTVFTRYAELLGERLGRASGKATPRVWCSWYSLYTAIHEKLLHRVFDNLGDLPFDVLQVDDGWQANIGDWEPNEKFPSGMEALAGKIRASGRTPGLWLAPLLVVPSSSLYRKHPDWLLREHGGKLVSAGNGWGKQLYTLDMTHPAVLGWLRSLMKKVRGWGFDYLKLDFLYAGALPGKRYNDMPRETAYRQGLQAMREAMGDNIYFLTCGAPIIPSLGLCDAIRVGPDVAGEWENHRNAVLLFNPTIPGTKNAIRTTFNRLWLRPLVATDPDVVYFRSQHNSMTSEQKDLLKNLALICNFKATSDLPQWLVDGERENLRAFLTAEPEIKRTGRYSFNLDGHIVDFSSAMPLSTLPHGLNLLMGAILGWLGNQKWMLKLLDRLGKRELRKMLSNMNLVD